MKIKIDINIPNEKLTRDGLLSLAYDLLEHIKGDIIFMDKDCSELKKPIYHVFNPESPLRSQEDKCLLGNFKITMD